MSHDNGAQRISSLFTRQKQEDAERRKQDEKARREIIFKQYMEKKLEKEEEETHDRRPSRAKPRPKSMFVRAKAAPPQNNLTSHGSNDSLSGHGSPGSASPGMSIKISKTNFRQSLITPLPIWLIGYDICLFVDTYQCYCFNSSFLD